jgi:hypothetical protein
MSRSAKFNLTVLLGFGLSFVLLSIAHAATGPDAPSPGSLVDQFLAAFKAGSPGLAALVGLELAEQGLLMAAGRWAALSKTVPYLTMASAVTAGALAAVATTGTVTLKSAGLALLVAGAGYLYSRPSARAAAKRDSQAGSVARDMLPVLGAVAFAATLAIAGALGCGATTKQIGRDVATCAKVSGDSALSAIEGQVLTDALDPPTLSAKLDALVSDLEADGLSGALAFVKCAATAVANDLAAKLHGNAGTSLAEAADAARSLDAVNTWLMAHPGDK